jgi:hypothetical protein
MKKNLSSSLRLSVFFILILIACQDKEVSVKKQLPPPNLSFLQPEREPSGARVGVGNQLFALEGDYLYRIYSDTREVELLGTGWSGTEAVTVFSGYLYGVQAGRLWKCNLTTATCADIGPNWEGTSFLTNDGSYIYGIQGNRLWKVQQNGSWQQLGNGEWGAATEMSFSNNPVVPSGVSVPYLYIQHGGTIYRVNKDLGTWSTFGSSTINPYTHPVSDIRNRNTSFLGILDGRFVRQNTGTGSLTNLSSAIWHGAIDISWVQFGSNYVSHVYILHGSQIHEYEEDIINPDNWVYKGTIPGLTGVYKIVSQQAR